MVHSLFSSGQKLVVPYRFILFTHGTHPKPFTSIDLAYVSVILGQFSRKIKTPKLLKLHNKTPKMCKER